MDLNNNEKEEFAFF